MTTKQDDSYKDIGKFGPFQFWQYFFIVVPIVIIAMNTVNYIFIAENVEYRCAVPECETESSTVETPFWWPDGVDTKCSKSLLINQTSHLIGKCINSSFQKDVVRCDNWIFESNNSMVAEYQLACQSWKPTLIGTMHNAGMLVSMTLMGWVSDRFGRKPTFVLCAVAGMVGLAKIFVNNYYAYIITEFLESTLSSGIYTVGIVLLMELGGESRRVLAGVVLSNSTTLGEIIFGFVAMNLKYWKYIAIFIYSPPIVFVGYIFIIRESVRWQLLRGKIEEAKNTLNVIIKTNKINITEKEMSAMDGESLRLKFNVAEQLEKENIRDIIRSKEIMKRLAVSSFCFFTASFVYYGLVVHSVFLPGDKYTNFMLTSLVSIPGDVFTLYAMEKFGRKITLQSSYMTCGLLLLAQSFTPTNMSWLKIILFLTGKFTIALSFTGMFSYSLELFPTSVRGSLVGWGNTVGRIGSLLSPLTPLLKTEMEALPSILFASTAVFASLTLVFTPETKNMPTFDTVAQIENESKLSCDTAL